MESQFEEEEEASGDQALPSRSSAKNVTGINALNFNQGNEDQAAAIVRKMDATGIPFMEFLNVFNKSAKEKTISIGNFLMIAKSAYPKVN